MSRTLSLAAVVALWGAALYGSTRLHTLELGVAPIFCGPWGCTATPEALVGYHLFWLALLAPAATLVAAWRPAGQAVRFGKALAAAGVIGIVLLVAGAAAEWLASGGAERYALQRGLFVVATTPDLPLGPAALAGLAAWTHGACRGRRARGSVAPPTETRADAAGEAGAVDR